MQTYLIRLPWQLAASALLLAGTAQAQTIVSSAIGQPAVGVSTSAGGATVYSGVYGAMVPPDVAGTPDGGSVSSSYSYEITATGGTEPYTFSAPDPSKLPPGLSLGADGKITGTPTAAGTYTFDVTVTDAAGLTDTASFTITITITDTAQPPQPPQTAAAVPVPASTPAGLALLSGLFGWWAWRRQGKQQQRKG